MKVFIAGVMQGNRKKHGIRSQNYRDRISNHLHKISRDLEVVDPDKTDPNRLSYNNQQAADMFFKYCDIAGKVNLLIAYIPEASMGSAIEMWVAYKSNVPILVISPLAHNWVVKLLSKKIYADLESFEKSFDRETLKELNLL